MAMVCIPFSTTLSAESWFDFQPGPDRFANSPIDLRPLNETFAGEHGRVLVSGDKFIHSDNGEEIRFWGVNGPPSGLQGEPLKQCARRLSKYGVNLVRIHGAVFDSLGEPDFKRIRFIQEAVRAMKAEGVYAHLSIYFPLWWTPSSDHPWMKGYDGKKHPFAALMFNPVFQEHYRAWWRALLLTPDASGHTLLEDPAVFGLEIQNEDSLFFWTFNPDQIPQAQLALLETRWSHWLKKKYGTLEQARLSWNGLTIPRDDFQAGRVSFRPLWNLFSEKTARDRDTAAFLFETQRDFYVEMVGFLKSLGFRGAVTTSNWNTASPEVLGPLERWSYTTGDFMDRHGYFSIAHKGDNAEWSIRNGHTYWDRSALRFEAPSPSKPKQFGHPIMEIEYDGKPSMLSETTWNRPNRYRSEAPIYYACYAALQGTDAIVHFALDGAQWSVKPGFWMQPWTLMAPSQIGQFPATALLYRRGLVKPGEVVAKLDLNKQDLLALKGTPLPQDANLDELRLKDIPHGKDLKAGERIPPLIHYTGRTEVRFTETPSQTWVADLTSFIDRSNQVILSSTRELQLDYKNGILTVNASAAQGVSGNLKAVGKTVLRDLEIESSSDNIHILIVSMDAKPIQQSKRMLLQVMTEERATDFQTESLDGGQRRITNLGRDPWQVREIDGRVIFTLPHVLEFQPLDLNGYPSAPPIRSQELKLAPRTLYYLATWDGR